MTCIHSSLSPSGRSRGEPRVLRGPLMDRSWPGQGPSGPSLEGATLSYHCYRWGGPSSDPGRQPQQILLPNPDPALASSWSRGWYQATDTAALMGPWSRTHGSAVSGRLAQEREPTLRWMCSLIITKTSSPTRPRPVMAARQVISHGHCGLDGAMVSDPRGSQCPVGSPSDWKGPQS